MGLDMQLARSNNQTISGPAADAQEKAQIRQASLTHSLIPERLSFVIQNAPFGGATDKIHFGAVDEHLDVSCCFDVSRIDRVGVLKFCRAINGHMEGRIHGHRHVVLCFCGYTETVFNAAFLLSAYMMLVHGASMDDAVQPFTKLIGTQTLEANIEHALNAKILRQRLGGLRRAHELGWTDDHHNTSTQGDADKFLSGSDSGLADLSRLCPKFIAFAEPDASSHNSSSCTSARALRAAGVSTVVRLSGDLEVSDTATLKAQGLRECLLLFSDSCAPSDALLLAFLSECSAARGRVAISCPQGIGRATTLVGAWLMRKHAFTASEAAAWMRFVSPDCLSEPQQMFLAALEDRQSYKSRLGIAALPRPRRGLSGGSRRRRRDHEPSLPPPETQTVRCGGSHGGEALALAAGPSASSSSQCPWHESEDFSIDGDSAERSDSEVTVTDEELEEEEEEAAARMAAAVEGLARTLRLLASADEGMEVQAGRERAHFWDRDGDAHSLAGSSSSSEC